MSLLNKSMFLEELLTSIQDINGNISSAKLRFLSKNYPKLYSQLLLQTNILPECSSLLERVVFLSNNYETRPACKCGSFCKFYKQNGGYYTTFCSTKCSYYREHINKSVKETFIDKYGSLSPFSCKEVQDKTKDTNIKKYGSINPMKNQEIKDKLKKRIQENYGVDNISKLESIKEKKKETCFKNYGVDNPSKSKKLREKVVETNLRKFGKDWYSKTKEFKDQVIKTNLENYGVNYTNQLHWTQETLDLIYDEEKFKNWILDRHSLDKMSGGEISATIGVCTRTIHNYCDKFNIKLKRHSKSSLEKDVSNWIKDSFNLDVEERDKTTLKGKEIDILLSEFNIGIEVNGLYWHSYNELEDKEEKLKHQKKSLLAKDMGIKLLTIFEHEWEDSDKKDIWKSIISYNLGQANNIFARKCEIITVSKEEAKKFFDENHIQGFSTSGQINIALKYKNKIVQMSSFGIPRFSKKYQWELIRMCSRKYTNITGGASRILKHFIRNNRPQSIVSYCNLTYGTGDVYPKLGFKFLHTTKPNYYYYKLNTLSVHSRLAFQKHKLFNKLENFDPQLTEAQNMFNHGYRRFWDCGNNTYVWYSN